MAGSRQMTREEALRYIKSAAGHLIVTDRKVVGMALLEAWDALRQSGWVRTADRAPTAEDSGYNKEVVAFCRINGTETIGCNYWQDISKYPKMFPYWLPLPPLPENAGAESTKINGGGRMTKAELDQSIAHYERERKRDNWADFSKTLKGIGSIGKIDEMCLEYEERFQARETALTVLRAEREKE